jgi:osmoprotectant transport system substrate-binding protein
LRRVSDLATVDDELTFGGPPECAARPQCLRGLRTVYGLRFKQFVPLDAGGHLTRAALDDGVVAVALLFTTDPALRSPDYVELVDDRHLQPAENVTPLVRRDTVERFGPKVTQIADAVSAQLSTGVLRGMNARVVGGESVASVASKWLKAQGLS